MKRTISILTAVSLMLTLCSSAFRTSAQKSGATKETKKESKEERRAKALKADWDRLPPLAKLGASPEAKAAWDGLTDKEREAVKAKVHSILGNEIGKLKTDKEARKAAVKRWKESRKAGDDDATLSYVGKDGKKKTIKAKKKEAATMDDDPASASAVDKKENGRTRAVKVAAQKPAATQKLADAQKSAAPWDERWAAEDLAHFNKASFKKASFGKPAAAPQSGDADIDGLPESFEDALAENFTPIYHTSSGEVDNYSTFHDMVPQTVKDRFGQNPVLYYRVTPLYIRYNPYRYMYESFIRIDYLTLWDHDSGLPDSECDIAPPFDSLIEGFGPHDIDNERSALLVSAPVFDPYNAWGFNLDANQYSALSVFTAAHENTFTDQSAYHNFPANPIWPGNHIELWHSLWKHATYTSNPNFHALIPEYIIFTEFFFIGYFFFDFYNPFCNDPYSFWDFGLDCPNGDPWSSPYFYLYLAAIYYTVVITFGCAVERFYEQGGQFANPRINVGEPFQPINGSSFILDNTYALYNKLRAPLSFENLIH